MHISIFDLFSIGIGPSSSHTVGPMKAACDFVTNLDARELLTQTHTLHVDLYGSLALTGIGHGTDIAIIMGLTGEHPESIDPEDLQEKVNTIYETKTLTILKKHTIQFDKTSHYLQHLKEILPLHTNGMRFSAYDDSNNVIAEEVYYSIGGGFIVTKDQFGKEPKQEAVPYPFDTAKELISHCEKNLLSISQIMLENEKTWCNEAEIQKGILTIYHVMQQCIEKGCRTSGILPGGLNVKRRAAEYYQKLKQAGMPKSHEFTDSMKWLNVYALAVNEENAAGGRIVTAPTNGAAGIVPAVLFYYANFYEDVSKDNIIEFLLTASAIAILYKKGASISGAEVGCQGEVGVAN